MNSEYKWKKDFFEEEEGTAIDNAENEEVEVMEEEYEGTTIDEMDKTNIFLDGLIKADISQDEHGIYSFIGTKKKYFTNFSYIEFLYTDIADGVRIRVVKIGQVEIRLEAKDLTTSSRFNQKLLQNSNYSVKMPAEMFREFADMILRLDNNKTVTNTQGFGKVSDNIWHLGNKVIVDGKLEEYNPIVWNGNLGHKLQATDYLSLSDEKFDLKGIWDFFYDLYGMKAVLVIGFALATLYYQEYLNAKKHFPLLYIRAGSGRGKNGLAGLICSLFGMSEALAYVNCASNATKIGTESKSLLLNNLPLVLDELSEEQFPYIKSRFDGQGSVKFHQNSPNDILERTVNGSTIITTVVEPKDKQIISRCVFVDLDDIKLKKTLYDEVRKQSVMFSSFTSSILSKISFDKIQKCVNEYKCDIHNCGSSPRIIENYSLIGGCFDVFREVVDSSTMLPDPEEVKIFLEIQIRKTEEYLNPLIYFMREIERLADSTLAKKYITSDYKFLYFNFNGVWDLIPEKFKKKYFPYMKSSDVKKLLKESEYIAIYGNDLQPIDKDKMGKQAISHSKKICTNSRRCYVLLKDKLPGYYK
jgi:hypothetical protein